MLKNLTISPNSLKKKKIITVTKTQHFIRSSHCHPAIAKKDRKKNVLCPSFQSSFLYLNSKKKINMAWFFLTLLFIKNKAGILSRHVVKNWIQNDCSITWLVRSPSIYGVRFCRKIEGFVRLNDYIRTFWIRLCMDINGIDRGVHYTMRWGL